LHQWFRSSFWKISRLFAHILEIFSDYSYVYSSAVLWGILMIIRNHSHEVHKRTSSNERNWRIESTMRIIQHFHYIFMVIWGHSQEVHVHNSRNESDWRTRDQRANNSTFFELFSDVPLLFEYHRYCIRFVSSVWFGRVFYGIIQRFSITQRREREVSVIGGLQLVGSLKL